jgi:hypothetical protein
MPVETNRWRRRLGIGLVVAALVAYEAYALFVKRSGEAAYLPSIEDTSLSPEIAGDVTLEQRFVMFADGLDTIRVFPHRSTSAPEGLVELVVIGEGYEQPVAQVSAPASVVAAAPMFEWRVPRVDQSTGRGFIIRMALPATSPGHGLRFEIGGPGYELGDLSFGGRSFWGDLKFSTRATRVRVIDSLADLRRQAPAILRSDLFLVVVLAAFNWALVTLVLRLAARADGVASGAPDHASRS